MMLACNCDQTWNNYNNSMWGPGRLQWRTVFGFIYVNDLDNNISNAIGNKATFFAYETNILITVRDS